MKTLLVYDLETSGLTPCDQILQYAAIRLNADTLEEISRDKIEVAWRRDMVPNIDAFMVHQIPANRELAVTELTAIVDIHAAVNQPGTQSGGYNTLGFDDEMLRFSFYRSLLPPYTHQYQDNCGRFDILPLVVFYYLYAPNAIKWPRKENGQVSFKLEDLNRENQWVEGRAHDALVDVEATVALMRHLKLHGKMWTYLNGYFDKSVDLSRIEALADQPAPYQNIGIMVHLPFGSVSQYQAPVLYLGPHHQFKNQHMFLRLDKPLLEVAEDNIERFIVKKKLAEPGFILPYNDKYKASLSEGVEEIVEQNIGFLANRDISALIEPQLQKGYESIEDIDLDAYLYQSNFLTREEQSFCEQFLISGENARQGLLEAVTNDVLKEQALRLLWRFCPEQIPDHLQQAAHRSISQFVMSAKDYRGRARPSPESTLAQINDLAIEDDYLKQGLETLKAHTEKVLSLIDTEYQ